MEAIKEAHNRRIDANAALIQALIRRKPVFVAYNQAKSAAVVVQKNARTFNAQRSYVKMRDESRFKAQLENRLAEAEKVAQASVSELDELRQQLAEEQKLRQAAEEKAAKLEAEVVQVQQSAGSDTASLSAEREKTVALETELGSLRAEAEQLKQDSSAAEQRHAEELR